MKKYKKYKDFIPYSFYLRSKEQEKTYEKRLIIVVLILNLLIMPINVKDLNKLSKDHVKLQESETYTDKESFRLETIITAANELFSDEFEEVCIDNGNGEIVVDTLDNADKLKDSNIINIREAHLAEGDKYKIGVSINER